MPYFQGKDFPKIEPGLKHCLADKLKDEMNTLEAYLVDYVRPDSPWGSELRVAPPADGTASVWNRPLLWATSHLIRRESDDGFKGAWAWLEHNEALVKQLYPNMNFAQFVVSGVDEDGNSDGARYNFRAIGPAFAHMHDGKFVGQSVEAKVGSMYKALLTMAPGMRMVGYGFNRLVCQQGAAHLFNNQNDDNRVTMVAPAGGVFASCEGTDLSTLKQRAKRTSHNRGNNIAFDNLIQKQMILMTKVDFDKTMAFDTLCRCTTRVQAPVEERQMRFEQASAKPANARTLIEKADILIPEKLVTAGVAPGERFVTPDQMKDAAINVTEKLYPGSWHWLQNAFLAKDRATSRFNKVLKRPRGALFNPDLAEARRVRARDADAVRQQAAVAIGMPVTRLDTARLDAFYATALQALQNLEVVPAGAGGGLGGGGRRIAQSDLDNQVRRISKMFNRNDGGQRVLAAVGQLPESELGIPVISELFKQNGVSDRDSENFGTTLKWVAHALRGDGVNVPVWNLREFAAQLVGNNAFAEDVEADVMDEDYEDLGSDSDSD